MNTLLTDIIKQHIKQNGPMGIDQYMALCLGHPEHGYYITNDPFGSEGDFTTAPEISQLFGDIIGLWVLDAYHRLGKPAQINLIEFGPGRGTLMSDILRIGMQDQSFLAAVQVHMVETSPVLKKAQQLALSYKEGIKAQWHEDISSITPNGPVIIIGNEFFDALPLKQYVYVKKQWHERVIGMGENGKLEMGMRAAPHVDTLIKEYDMPSPSPLDIFEHAPIRENIMTQIADLISTNKGTGLFIDYGHEKTSYGDTLQAVQGHQYSPVLEDCGKADLTSHVDFASLTKAIKDHKSSDKAQKINILPIISQQQFLTSLGIEMWAQKLAGANNLPQDDLEKLNAGKERLVSPKQMGQLFKVMCIEAM